MISDEDMEKEFVKLHEWGSEILKIKIEDLKGFYVKTGQIISTRVDIFPVEYTSKLASTLDDLDPLPASVVKDIIKKELLNGAELSDLFLEFDDKPLGSASIAQVQMYAYVNIYNANTYMFMQNMQICICIGVI